jgi:hypothetical protein
MVGIVKNRRWLVVLSALCFSAMLLVWIGWTSWHGATSREADINLTRASELSGIPGIRPALMQLGLLCDYYEHVGEHVPPFQSDDVMQRREWFYTPPREPFELLRSNLRNTPPDHELSQRLVRLQTSWEKDGATQSIDLADLKRSLEQSSIAPEMLVESGRAMTFLAGDNLAAIFFHAGLDKALHQYKSLRPGDPSALPLLRELDQTKALQRLLDYPGLEKRFALEMALYPPLSVESRRAGCLHAAALFDQAKVPLAADAILQVFEQDRQAGDLDAAGMAEMDWRTQRYLAAAGRFEEAIPYCKDLLTTNDGRKVTVAKLWVAYLRHLGRDIEADAVRDRYKVGPVIHSTPTSRPVAGSSDLPIHSFRVQPPAPTESELQLAANPSWN